jgi:hypothetical protein
LSTLTLSSINLEKGTCTVQVDEFVDATSASATQFIGVCSDMGCNISGSEKTNGYDVSIDISCPKFELNGDTTGTIYRFSKPYATNPVHVDVDNCR